MCNFIKDYGSIISNVITVTLFVLGFIREKNKERKKEEKNQKEKLKYLATLINSSLKNTKLNSSSLEKTIENFNKDSSTFHLLEWHVSYDTKRITEKLNLEDYYLSYITQFKEGKEITEEYQKIVSSLDAIFEIFTQLFIQAEKAQANDYERKKPISELSDKIDSLIKKVNSNLNIWQLPEAFKENFIKIIGNWVAEKNKENVYLFVEILCKPLYELLLSFSQQNKNIPPEFDSLMELLLQVKFEVRFVQSGNLKYAESLQLQLEEVKKTIKTLEASSKRVRTYLENSN